jgi:hypothetical protein
MRRLLPFAAVLVIVACAPSSGVATATTRAPSSAALADPTRAPSSTATSPPVATDGPVVTPKPEATQAVTLSPAERDLVAELRDDAVVNCTPRRTDLPPRAVAGVECRPDSDVVERVGIYRFRSDEDAALAYLERMASYGVRLDTGRCDLGEPGDQSSGLEGGPTVVFDGKTLDARRNGCFLDENGIANYRLTCWGRALYVGVLGRTSDLAALNNWVQMGIAETPGPPPICLPVP